jgi:hypothetical protein
MERSKNEAEAYSNDVIQEHEEKLQEFYKLQKLIKNKWSQNQEGEAAASCNLQ